MHAQCIILLSVTVVVSCGWTVTTGLSGRSEIQSNVGDTVALNEYEDALRSDGDRRDDGRDKLLRPVSRVARARSGRPDDMPCPSVVGPWMSSSLETVFEVSATSLAGRLNLKAVGSNWKGAMETLFGTSGPLSVIINQPVTGTVATFVGHCRTVDGVDSIIGAYT